MTNTNLQFTNPTEALDAIEQAFNRFLHYVNGVHESGERGPTSSEIEDAHRQAQETLTHLATLKQQVAEGR